MYHRRSLSHAVIELLQFSAPKPAKFWVSLLSRSLLGSIFPTQHRPKKQEKWTSANSGVWLYCMSPVRSWAQMCAAGPKKAQICRTISLHLTHLNTEMGPLGKREHWRVLCKDWTDIAQEGREDVQVMVCSWAVTNTNRVGSNILVGLKLCFSAPEGLPSCPAMKGTVSSATHTDQAGPTRADDLVSTRNSPLLRSIHQFPWTRALRPSAVILQTPMKTEMVKLKTFSYSNTPLCLQHPHCTEVVHLGYKNSAVWGSCFQILFRTHLIRLKTIIDPYGFNRSVG